MGTLLFGQVFLPVGLETRIAFEQPQILCHVALRFLAVFWQSETARDWGAQRPGRLRKSNKADIGLSRVETGRFFVR